MFSRWEKVSGAIMDARPDRRKAGPPAQGENQSERPTGLQAAAGPAARRFFRSQYHATQMHIS